MNIVLIAVVVVAAGCGGSSSGSGVVIPRSTVPVAPVVGASPSVVIRRSRSQGQGPPVPMPVAPMATCSFSVSLVFSSLTATTTLPSGPPRSSSSFSRRRRICRRCRPRTCVGCSRTNGRGAAVGAGIGADVADCVVVGGGSTDWVTSTSTRRECNKPLGWRCSLSCALRLSNPRPSRWSWKPRSSGWGGCGWDGCDDGAAAAAAAADGSSTGGSSTGGG
mmetsp:Transcript_25266/g.54989  ORF Transcript_25266/g.54989 Transcript_25266/m.54989 type:complete len:220 (-) Transcript_25266:326-985(-)